MVSGIKASDAKAIIGEFFHDVSSDSLPPWLRKSANGGLDEEEDQDEKGGSQDD